MDLPTLYENRYELYSTFTMHTITYITHHFPSRYQQFSSTWCLCNNTTIICARETRYDAPTIEYGAHLQLGQYGNALCISGEKFGWGLCNNLGHIATKDATISDENYYFGISMEEITTV